ncbi:uncharacterized protein O8D03_001430 [Erethizon dorsatum]
MPGQAERPTTQFHAAPPGFQTTTQELCTIESRFDCLRSRRGPTGIRTAGESLRSFKSHPRLLPETSGHRPPPSGCGSRPPPSLPVLLPKSQVPSVPQALWVTFLEPPWDSAVETPMWQSPRNLESSTKHRQRCRGKSPSPAGGVSPNPPRGPHAARSPEMTPTTLTFRPSKLESPPGLAPRSVPAPGPPRRTPGLPLDSAPGALPGTKLRPRALQGDTAACLPRNS